MPGVVAVALSFSAAIAALRQTESQEAAVLVLTDKPLQAVLACWPMVQRRLPPPGFAADGLSLEQLWSVVEFEEREVVELSGLPQGVALVALRRARGNRLIYPDGSVHQLARGVLTKLLKDALQKGKAR